MAELLQAKVNNRACPLLQVTWTADVIRKKKKDDKDTGIF